MRRETSRERAAWTEFVDGKAGEAPKQSKYGNKRCELNGRTYPSIREANHAAKLQALASAGKIREYKEQHRITLVPGDGRLQPIVYVADFTYIDDDGFHVVDAKGYKHPIYRLKKRLAALLLRITIEEV